MPAFLFILYSFVLNGQNNPIDSLKEVLQTQKEDTNRVKTLIKLGSVLADSIEYDNALKYTNEARVLSAKLGFKRGQGQAYEAIAWIHQIRGDYPEAKSNYLSGITIYEELGSKSKVANLTNRVAASYYTEGDITEALKTSYDALKIYEELKEKSGIAYTYLLLGGFYYVDKNYSESLKNFQTGLKLYDELGDKFGVTYTRLQIRRIDVQQGNNTEALRKFVEVLKVFEKEKIEPWIAETHIYMGELFERLGDNNKINPQTNYSEALKNYIQNLSFYEKIRDNGAITTGYYYVGKINIKLGNLQAAKVYLEKALQLAREIGSKGDLRDTYQSFSVLDSSQGDYKQAYEHHKMYILYRDSVSNEETKKKLVRVSMQYEFDKKEALARAEREKKIYWQNVHGIYSTLQSEQFY